MPPSWLEAIAWASLISALVCAAIIVLDIFVGRYRQKMGVMEWVWPITALYLGVFGLAFYWLVGRRTTPKYEAAHGPRQFPYWVRVGISASHCGGGCTLGDILAETLIYVTGITIFGATIWASFLFDYSFALLLGIAFQFAAVRAMARLTFGRAVGRAAKADALSLTAFEVGLFTWMALMFWVFFPDPHLQPNTASYWFLMQVGMATGYLTSYPMNMFLIHRGIKEAM